MAGEDDKRCEKKVVIVSRLRNAVSLRVDEMIGADAHGQAGYAAAGPGEKMARQKGPSIEMRPGRNEIDPAFWREWLEQNKDGDLAKALEEQPEESTVTKEA